MPSSQKQFHAQSLSRALRAWLRNEGSHRPAVKLLRAGADPNERVPQKDPMALSGHPKVELCAFELPVAQQRTDILSLLSDEGKPPTANTFGLMAIRAVVTGAPKVLEWIMEQGVDMEQLRLSYHGKNETITGHALSLTEYAAAEGKPSILEWCRDHRLALPQSDLNPISICLMGDPYSFSDTELRSLHILFDMGADPALRSASGYSAFDILAAKALTQKHLVSTLVEDPDEENSAFHQVLSLLLAAPSSMASLATLNAEGEDAFGLLCQVGPRTAAILAALRQAELSDAMPSHVRVSRHPRPRM